MLQNLLRKNYPIDKWLTPSPICEQTVKDYLHDVFGKLKIKRRSELASKMKMLGFDTH